MKRAIAFLAVMAVMCSSVSAYAAPAKALEAVGMEDYNQQISTTETPDLDAPHKTVTENDFEFYVYEDFAYLTDCKDRTITEAVIPEEAAGVPVIGITNAPFGLCRNLQTITLPDTLQYFEWRDLVIPITVLGSNEKDPMPSVSKVKVSESNPYYTVSDGILYSKDMKTLIGCPPVMGLKELKISEQTDTIGDYAFALCIGLETAVIPEHIEHICNSAFAGCPDLVKAEWPENITFISGDTFYLCDSLSEITFRGTIEKIGYGAFNKCGALTDFTIPETVTFIGSAAFENAGCVENENGVHYVDDWAVGSDETVTSIVLKEGTVGIAEMSFLSRSDLKLFEIPESVKHTGDLILGLLANTPLRINCRNGFIDERSLIAVKNATDVYIYDPECEISDSEKAIPAEYNYTVHLKDDEGFPYDSKVSGDVVIHGYENSTAQAYAEKYGRQFALIGADVLSGDINADGTFSVADVILLQKWLLAVPDTKLPDWKAADLYEDNRLDGFDLALMKRALLQATQSEDISIALYETVDIRTNADAHHEQQVYVVNTMEELQEIVAAKEQCDYKDSAVTGIDEAFFAEHSLILLYTKAGAGNMYTIVDDITLTGNTLTISTVTKNPEIGTPDMMYRRYAFTVSKNTAGDMILTSCSGTATTYPYAEQNEVQQWFHAWSQTAAQLS